MTFEDLIEAARHVKMTQEEREAQRRSFVYGNLKIENDRITRETIDDAVQEVGKGPPSTSSVVGSPMQVERHARP